ncbi:hypothetical protein [Geovibrio ferrireducens]|uniref:hypothetical protein n=1 Tax=Geovibrio ferrireducens TaxID=46201 RepID=UPI002245ED2A|nr:hypothetical protein [Geovibrio ferrireducens]
MAAIYFETKDRYVVLTEEKDAAIEAATDQEGEDFIVTAEYGDEELYSFSRKKDAQDKADDLNKEYGVQSHFFISAVHKGYAVSVRGFFISVAEREQADETGKGEMSKLTLEKAFRLNENVVRALYFHNDRRQEFMVEWSNIDHNGEVADNYYLTQDYCLASDESLRTEVITAMQEGETGERDDLYLEIRDTFDAGDAENLEN